MLLNISGRTDIVNHYPDWLFKRFEEGYVLSRNSLFQNSVRRYELTPDKIDCLIFGSKNYAPVLDRIHELTERFSTYFYYTITAYGKDVEPGVPDIDTSIVTLLKLSEIVGARRVAWRYDPVLLTEKYTIQQHFETFAYMAQRLSGHINRCIFSFVEMYKKHEVNFPELIPLKEEEKDELARGLGAIAAKHGIIIQTCGPEESYAGYGIQTSGCVTLDILGQANGLEFRHLKHKGFRQGCHCIESRDIGALNSCPNGCKYCYANKNAQLPRENYQLHDPESPLLIGHLNPTDRLEQGAQKTFLKNPLKIQEE
ncbi:MAG: DUF1848 domain-containing protein [Anaerotignum sp.]|nr:DUF1848 domain-containing protein [Anaerotignum sp.]